MSAKHSRRALLRGAVDEAARAIATMAGTDADEIDRSPGQTAAKSQQVGPSERTAGLDQLDTFANELDLSRRVPELRALARWSLRLTHGPEGHAGLEHGSRFGGRPSNPSPDAGDLALQIDLAEATAALGQTVLGADAGILGCHLGAQADGFRAKILIAPTPPRRESPWPRRPRVTGLELTLSSELTLPRAWAAAAEKLDLTFGEQQAWQELRRRLARWQGVTLADETPEPQAIHRLLGYPDERSGLMPLRCELSARGLTLEAHELDQLPERAEIHAASQRWRLLAQLSADPELDWSWGAGRERLYIWIDGPALATADFSAVCAFAQ
jgi:hypothetical protein